ncbi:hypothetical protein SYNPS1DRAFT_25338 [Syncephalis pseudoplumigaleata]|uniref:Uncharacterized protein n=1 Tax=Syncephalis pseudoplumigaleata TaxID=1712513 RepID=A0A4P9YSN9_9FUNG|nr:hypothetical protein SYNPS1DRAFT_25338 [Syncephalis pseudoplumigaleata]|eukprot:RKP22784.1 hypothetical protein SYNPS1DRAFT_25338 [Syncephalis pseudoplumigaleata]
MSNYPGAPAYSNNNDGTHQPPPAPYPTAMPAPPATTDEKPPVDAHGYPMPAGHQHPPHEYYAAAPDAQKYMAGNGQPEHAKNGYMAAPPLPATGDPHNIPPSGPNGQYTVEDYQRMAEARKPRFPIEQYGRCPKDGGEHYVREEYTNGSLCLACMIGWIFPVCISRQLKCRKCGQVF